MDQQHVGKKRRKEVRDAVNMKNEMRSMTLFIVCILFLVAAASAFCAWASLDGIIKNEALSVFIPLLIVFVAVLGVGSRASGYLALRDKYKNHCQKFNITESDMQACKHGDL